VNAEELRHLNSAWYAHLQGNVRLPAPEGLVLTNKFVDGLLYCTTSYANRSSASATDPQVALVAGTPPSAEDFGTLCYVVFIKQLYAFLRMDGPSLHFFLEMFHLGDSVTTPIENEADQEASIERVRARIVGEENAKEEEEEDDGDGLVYAAEEDPDDYEYEGDEVCTQGEDTLASKQHKKELTELTNEMTSAMIRKVQMLTSKLGYGIVSSLSVREWESHETTESVIACVALILQCIDPSYTVCISASESGSMEASVFMATAADWSTSASPLRESMISLLLELYPRLLFVLRDRLLALLVEPAKPASQPPSCAREEEAATKGKAEAAVTAGTSAAKIVGVLVELLLGCATAESTDNNAAGLTEEDAAARAGFAEAIRLDLRGCVLSVLSAVRTALDANDSASGNTCGSPVTAAVRNAVRDGLWRGVESILPILSTSLAMPPPTDAEVDDEPTTLAEAVGEAQAAGAGSADSRKRRVLVSILLSTVRLLNFYVRKDPRMQPSEYSVKQLIAKGALRNAITIFNTMPLPRMPSSEDGATGKEGGGMDAEQLAETISWQQELQQMLHCCCIASATAADFVVRSRGFVGRLSGTVVASTGSSATGSSATGGGLERSYHAETIVWAIILSASTSTPPTSSSKTTDADPHGLAELAFASLDRLLPPLPPALAADVPSKSAGEPPSDDVAKRASDGVATSTIQRAKTCMLQLDRLCDDDGGSIARGSGTTQPLHRRQQQLSHLHEVLRLLLLLAPARTLLRQWHPLPLRVGRLRSRLEAVQAEMQQMPRELVVLSVSLPRSTPSAVGAAGAGGAAGGVGLVGLAADRVRMKLAKDGDEAAANEATDARAVETFKCRGNDLLKAKELEAAALCYGEGIRLCLRHGGAAGGVGAGDDDSTEQNRAEGGVSAEDGVSAVSASSKPEGGGGGGGGPSESEAAVQTRPMVPMVQGLSALQQYHQQTVHAPDCFVPHLRLEAIKCFANRSLAYLQLQQQHKKEDSAVASADGSTTESTDSSASTLARAGLAGQQSLLQQSLADGEQSVVLDEKYVKGYFRIAKALQELDLLAIAMSKDEQQTDGLQVSIPLKPMLVEAKKAMRIGKQLQKKEKEAAAIAGAGGGDAVGSSEATAQEDASEEATKGMVSKAAIAGVLHKIRRALKVMLQLEGSKSD
jgi:hypothetical protein